MNKLILFICLSTSIALHAQDKKPKPFGSIQREETTCYVRQQPDHFQPDIHYPGNLKPTDKKNPFMKFTSVFSTMATIVEKTEEQ